MGPLNQRSPVTTPSGPDDRQDPEASAPRHHARRPLAQEWAFAHLIMVIGLLAMVLYAMFRVSTFGDEGSFWPINLVLIAGEVLAMVAQVALVYDGWRLLPFDPPIGTARPAVDVLVPVYNEPVEVVRPTLAGCLGQDYDGPFEIWLLDDGRRTEMAELAEMLGITYVTRPDNRGAKAGNINNALNLLRGELVTMLDCDMVPQPDYLSSLVPYFDDEEVALVQTPHGFYNTDSFQHYSESRHDQSLFYDVIQWGKDRHNAAYWCGTGGMLRTEALTEVGGVAEGTITEDFHTSVRLHAAGWRSRYHPVALSFGLGASDHSSYICQRDRWGSGNIALLHTDDSPLTVPGLTLWQRLSYVATLIAVLAGLRRILLIVGVALILGSGRIPFEAEPNWVMPSCSRPTGWRRRSSARSGVSATPSVSGSSTYRLTPASSSIVSAMWTAWPTTSATARPTTSVTARPAPDPTPETWSRRRPNSRWVKSANVDGQRWRGDRCRRPGSGGPVDPGAECGDGRHTRSDECSGMDQPRSRRNELQNGQIGRSRRIGPQRRPTGSAPQAPPRDGCVPGRTVSTDDEALDIHPETR